MSIFNPEDSILKVLMGNSAAYWQVCELICPEDFTPKGRKLYEAIAAEIRAGNPCDSVTLAISLGDSLGMYAYDIASNALGQTNNLLTYAKMLSEAGEAKRVREAGERIAICGGYDEAQLLLADVRPQQASRVKTAKDGISEMLDAMQLRSNGPYGLTWGVPGVDAIAGRLVESRLYGIAARAKMGKTTLALTPQLATVLADKRVLSFSLEMTAGELTQRAVSNIGRILHEYFEREEGPPDEMWPMFHAAAEKLHNAPWLIDDQPALSLEQITSRAIQHHMESPLGLIVIDHIGLVALPRRKNASRNDELGEVSYGLKNLAKKLRVPILAACQLNRNLESRMDKRPMASDLRDSGNLEQDFDCMLSVYRDEVYDDASADKGHAEIDTMFNRHGRGGSVFVSADLDYMTYAEAKRPRQCYPGRHGANQHTGRGSSFSGFSGKGGQPRQISVVRGDS